MMNLTMTKLTKKTELRSRRTLRLAAVILPMSLAAAGCAEFIANTFESIGTRSTSETAPETAPETTETVIDVRPIESPPLPDRNARSEFNVEKIVAHEYLVLTIEIKADSITLKKAGLLRGPRIANSAADDLRIKTYDGEELINEYSIADPRFVRRQAGHGMTQGHEWMVSVAALKRIYIDLRTDIDKVEVVPAPRSRAGVSTGGSFDPRAIAAMACKADKTDRFPACDEFPDGSWELITN